MINVNQQALLELLKASLFGIEPRFPDCVDWDAVLQEAKDQTVIALAAPAVPKEETEKWRVPVTRNKMRFLQILDEQTILVKLFQNAGIPLTILKGCAAAMYYPEPLQRTMGGIDFIVTPERFEDARRLMEDNGYKFDHDLGNDREYSYCKGDIILELHHRYSDVGWDIDPLIMDGLTHPVISELYGKAFPALPVEINGLVLLDHIRHHIRQGLGIRQIIDWMMFLHSFEGDDVWNSRFAPLVREAGLETFAATVTKMCRCWFGLPDEITWCDHADDDLAQELLETLFQFGNFGNKTSQEERPVETVTMNIRKKGLFRYLQTVGVSNWKACQKHKILQPFAWLYQIFRYIVKGFTELFRGEKIVKDLKRGNKKSDFMKKTGIEKRVDS